MSPMRTALTILLGVTCLLTTGRVRADEPPSTLRCEYLANPPGIDVARPRLGWVVPCRRRGQRQTAYRVLVAASNEELAADSGSLWDSGRVESDRSTLVEYAGRPLRSRDRCHWKVMVWDERGRPSAWSDPAFWSMGLLKRPTGTPAGSPGPKPPRRATRPPRSGSAKRSRCRRCPGERRSTSPPSDTTNCTSTAARWADQVLSPAVCDYRHRALYLTCDVAEYLSRRQ